MQVKGKEFYMKLEKYNKEAYLKANLNANILTDMENRMQNCTCKIHYFYAQYSKLSNNKYSKTPWMLGDAPTDVVTYAKNMCNITNNGVHIEYDGTAWGMLPKIIITYNESRTEKKVVTYTITTC